MENNQNIAVLIRHYSDHTISEEELSELSSWLEESDKHYEEFVETASILSAVSVSEDPLLQQRKEEMLSRLHVRIDAHESSARRLHRWFYPACAGIAAAVAVIVGLFAINRLRAPEPRVSTQLFTYVNPSSDVASIHLEDGTSVLLGAFSKLEYQRESSIFEDHSRLAHVCGSAYFDVARDTLCPFIVNADDILVRVLGTKFIVESHPDSTRTKVFLEQGSVSLRTPQGEDLVRLAENQRATYDKISTDLDVGPEEVGSYVLDRFKKISFSGIGFEDLVTQIEHIYDVSLEADRETDSQTRYEININRSNTLDDVLDLIETLTGVRLQEKK